MVTAVWGAHAPSRAGDDALVIANFLTGNFAWGRDNLPARSIVDGVEAVVVLVAFRRFAQFPRAMSAREPAPARRRAAATIIIKLEHDLGHYRSLPPP
jgi:hypothetical protein